MDEYLTLYNELFSTRQKITKMFLKDITKSRFNREHSQIYDLRKSLIFHIQGNVHTNEDYFEYRLHTVDKTVFDQG